MSNPALGRGLDALFSRKRTDDQSQTSSQTIPLHVSDSPIIQLPVSLLEANTQQPRTTFNEEQLKELADSIREYGIIQPLVVVKEGERYRLIAGERRLRAAKQVGLSVIPVVVREADEHERLAIALIENIQRVDLNPIECARAYKRLKDEFNLTQDDVAKRLGKSRPVIANTLRLLNLPDVIQEGLQQGTVSEGHGKLLAGLSSSEEQTNLFREILENKMNVRQTDSRIRMISKKEQRTPSTVKDPTLTAKEELLQTHLGTPVTITPRGEGGVITVTFYSREQLHEILTTMIQS